MSTPNGWQPSEFAKAVFGEQLYADPAEASGIAELSEEDAAGALRKYPTDAERFDSVAFFMRHNIGINAFRRNYTVQPGGNILYFKKQGVKP